MPTKKSFLSFKFSPETFSFESIPESFNAKQSPIEFLYNYGYQAKSFECDNSSLFLFSIADKFFVSLSKAEGLELSREKTVVQLSDDIINTILSETPFSLGWEFINPQWIKNIWTGLNNIFSNEIEKYQGTVQMYLAEKNQNLRVGEKIFFHLVENRSDENFPFAFIATYSRKEENNKISHLPLKYALSEYKDDNTKTLNLLSCLNKAGEASPLIASFMDSGEMFHPLKLKANEAWDFLKSIPAIEESGIVCRIPDWWKKNNHKVRIGAKIGETKSNLLGLDSILQMQGFLEVDGIQFTEQEIQELLQQTEGLSFIKGKWIEVDHKRLAELLEQVESYSKLISFGDALRMTINTISNDNSEDNFTPKITNGTWLKQVLTSLRNPDEKLVEPSKSFTAKLRPYQEKGFSWLYQMSKLRFGACLADDMGLGKTIQVLAYLDKVYSENPNSKNLLVVPASLLGNWQKECAKFAPKIKYQVLHGKSKNEITEEDFISSILKNDASLFITTYGQVTKNESLKKIQWNTLILDEAQAIKNAGTQQTKQIKYLNADFRIALTGTPIENNLMNLWSLFDFLNKGLLGTPNQFKKFSNSLKGNPSGNSKLKNMISPFLLRRLKTDKKIISDLPEKIETKDYVTLSKKQSILYKKFLDNLESDLQKNQTGQNIKRQALVLSSLIKLKQICNHPSQYLGAENYSEKDSGKFAMLREICQTIYEKREKVIIFTQFKEIIKYLDEYLSEIFERKGFVLHGGTQIKKRTQMVEAFQSDEYIPYMILSLKAGGTGLNLTKANHVIHFDRWWNPAVENQATDRAYRIGQTQNVIVHKLVCKGTIEEKIDTLIDSKKELAQNIIGDSSESWITKLSDQELLDLMRME